VAGGAQFRRWNTSGDRRNLEPARMSPRNVEEAVGAFERAKPADMNFAPDGINR
jgi:hypothetical protein